MTTRPVHRPFHERLADILRWARANDWRPKHPTSRRLGQYTWTNQVPDPGNRRQSTMRVTVDISGRTEIRQHMQTGWVAVGWFNAGSGQAVVDVLAAMSVLPERFSRAYREGRRDEAMERPAAGK
jgi:hypothetical protein